MDHGTGEINYTQFLAATMDRQQYLQEEAMRAAFGVFDLNGKGHFGEQELTLLLCEGADGGVAHEEDSELSSMCQRIIDEVDTNGDGVIDFDEFVAMMKC